MRKIFGLILLALTIVCITSCGGNKYTITLKKFDDESTITAKKGEVVELEPVEVDGYLFIGWYDKNDELVENVTVKENITFTAKFIEYGTSWNISYDLAGGDWSLNPGDLYKYGKDRAAMVDDFLNDAMAWAGKTNKPTCMVDDSGDAYGFANVFSAI